MSLVRSSDSQIILPASSSQVRFANAVTFNEAFVPDYSGEYRDGIGPSSQLP